MGRKAKYPPSIFPHKSSGRDRVRWQGVDYYLGPIGSAESRRRYRELLAEIERHGAPLARNTGTFTVEQLVDWWLGWAPRHYRATSREPQLFREPLRVLRDVCGTVAVAEFRAAHLKGVRDAFAARYCRNVANRHLVRVKTAFRQAGEEGVIPEEVYGRLRVVKAIPPGTPGVREMPPVPAADDGELEKVIGACPAPVAAMLAAARLSGCRPGEARLLHPSLCERRPDGSIVYRRGPSDGHKTAYLGRTRVIVFGPRAARILSPWLHAAAADGGFVFRPSDAPKSRGRRGLNPHYSACTLPRAVARAAATVAASLTPRQLRHAFKLDALDAAGVAAAMAALGQSSSKAFDGYGRAGRQAGQAVDDLLRRIG
jgi:integrase